MATRVVHITCVELYCVQSHKLNYRASRSGFFCIFCFRKLASHNPKMFPYIIFLWSQGKNLLQTCFSSCQLSLFNPNNTKVVSGLHMPWFTVQDPKVTTLGKVKVSDVVGVDVSQQDEAFHVVRVVLKQLLQRSNSLKRSVLVSKQ